MAHGNDYLPVPNPTLPYWRTELHKLDSHRSTPDLPSECDVLIIGAGLSGVSVAYHLSQQHEEDQPGSAAAAPPPPPSIVLLEARQVCSGATGRNGGHAKMKTASILSSLARRGGAATAAAVAFVDAQIAALKDAVQREGLDCEFELRRSWDAFVGGAEEAAEVEAGWRAAVARGDAWTRERDWVEGGPRLASALTGVRDARAAVSGPVCSLWPYKFVTQLLARAMERNPRLNLQTETPVLGVEEQQVEDDDDNDGTTLVLTSRGTVRARKVVFATNGYTAGLLPQYRGVITPYKGTAAHLVPPPGKGPVFPHLGHTYNLHWTVENETNTVDYFNPRPDGGIVVGGGSWLYRDREELWLDTVDDSTLLEPVVEQKYFEGYMQRHFRGWEDSGTVVDKIWTGIQAQTGDGLPHAGQVPNHRNHFILAGYNGGGMAYIFLLSKGIAQMVRDGVSFEETDSIIPRAIKTSEARMKC
ncbi:FAD dependent oxidoreductase [Xylariaceae sp. FL0804]|nr:FAD dependent oxidoreductase [Xylariaceae sp. FL0804]